MTLLLVVAVLGVLFPAIAADNLVNYTAVKVDIKAALTQSQAFWPADIYHGIAHYGPLMIRQAWHCAGSYRVSDGNGGCDGARQRFDPERSWDDNTNLDKSKKLLWPIKQKYGEALSWGDLIVLAGDSAIESMGGPILGFCGGRKDDEDGTDSLLLGPTAEQNASMPCPVNGQCKSPLGPTTLGLIYVNPEGPMSEPDPVRSAPQIRDTFSRMAMDDYETVALIGGGHAFGKTHGKCPLGPGPKPSEDPVNPWPGKCGTGKGPDTFTSGFEGSWTAYPTRWGNSYFTNLLNFTWESYMGQGGKNQWRVANDSSVNLMMLTSDIALTKDDKYLGIVREYAADQSKLDYFFSRAWYKLMTRDMGPLSRCVGPLTPSAQPFQYPLPAPPSSNVAYSTLKSEIKNVMTKSVPDLAPDNNTTPYYGAVFVYLAHQCASTFRRSDYLGGCNGARIRSPIQANWSVNLAMDKAMKVLEPVKTKFDNQLTWADLIVAAGQVAIEEAGGKSISFCPGRSDALANDTGSELLSPNLDMNATPFQQRQWLINSGLTSREMVVLSARMRSPVHMSRLGFVGTTWTTDSSKLSNAYFQILLSESWVSFTSPGGFLQYKADGKDLYMVQTDVNIKYESDWLAIAQEYAGDNELFLTDFSNAWSKLMNLDRFSGPSSNVCAPPSSSPADSSSSGMPSYGVALISIFVTLVVAIFIYCACLRPAPKKDTFLS